MKYGLLKYDSTRNLGDEIQSIAARRFLPKIDYYIDRDEIKHFKASEEVKAILNGWYMNKPKNWPPAENIKPLLVSMHISKINESINAFLSPESKDFLRQNGPVGARDLSTLKILQDNDIPAYFSGCLTLTLEKNPELFKRDYILAIDISDELYNFLRSKTSRPIYRTNQYMPRVLKSEDKFLLAEYILGLYQEAHCVVTNRLHVAMPCTALETPVLVIDSNIDEEDRFAGLDNFVRHVTEQEYMNNYEIFNLDNPESNPNTHLEVRNQLIKRCEEFIGYKAENPSFTLNSIVSKGELNVAVLDMVNRKLANHSTKYLSSILFGKFMKNVRSIVRLKI